MLEHTCRLLFPGDDDGGPGCLTVLFQRHVQAEQVLGVLVHKPLAKNITFFISQLEKALTMCLSVAELPGAGMRLQPSALAHGVCARLGCPGT